MAIKLNLDQDDVKRFFFLHVEKVIMGVGAFLLLLFFWFGWKTIPYSTRTPEGLKELASQATNYVQSDNWPTIAAYRKADVNVAERIKSSASIKADVDKYGIDVISGKRVKDASLRRDPELYPARGLIARSMTLPLIAKPLNPLVNKVDELETAASSKSGEDRRPGLGSGNSASDEDLSQKDDAKKKKTPPKDFGESFDDIHRMEMLGVRPEKMENMSTVVMPVVEVVGLVPFQNQWAKYDEVFLDAKLYHPDRDRPVYLYLEVARQIEGEEWNEKYYKSSYDLEAALFNEKKSPEVVDPNYFDKVLTRPLPPIAVLDFREFATHPEVPLRNFVPTFLWNKAEKNTRLMDAGTLLSDAKAAQDKKAEDEKKEGEPEAKAKDKLSDSKMEELLKMRGDNNLLYDQAMVATKPTAPTKLIRFFDYDPPVAKKVRYKVRLWLLDSNDPPDQVDTEAGKKKKDTPSLAGAGDDSDGQNNQTTAKKAYKKEPIRPDSINVEVAKRLMDKRNILLDDLPDPLLAFARSTEWSEPTEFVEVKKSELANVYAGMVSESNLLKIGPAQIAKEEPTANVVTAVVSQDYQAVVPASRDVYRGDLLNFVAEKVNLLHPMKLAVLRMNNAKIKSDIVVVDIMGGRELDLGAIKASSAAPNPVDGFKGTPTNESGMGINQMPGELLVMDGNGQFRIQSSIKDYGKYRASLFLPDESKEYGKKKEEKPVSKGAGKGGGDNNNRGGDGN